MNSLRSLDFFGESVRFTFNNHRRYTTWIGFTATLICAFILIIFFVTRTRKLVLMDDPLFSMTPVTQVAGPTDLFELGFVFAISKVDPSIATPRVEHTYWNETQDKVKTRIEMVDCAELLLQGGKHEKWGEDF